MSKHRFALLFSFVLLAASPVQAQECFFLKNVLDTIYRVEPANGIVSADSLPTDFPGQSFFGYLATIDAIGRRYMFVARTSPTNFNDFGLKVVDLDSMSISSVPLSNYQAASPGLGQFSFHGLEYGAIADQLYMAPVSGDSLYQIDYTTGVVSAVQEIPGFANTYSYLHTFYQSEQRYAMISTDAQGQKRFFQVDLDDDTTYVSPPMNFPEPLRGLEVSEASGEYYVVSDSDQTFYRVDPLTGTLTALFPIPAYQSAFGYLHTFDFTTNQYIMVGLDTLDNDSLSLFSIFPDSQMVNRIAFPFPQAGWFGLEATNTQFLARMVQDLNNNNTTSIFGQAAPLPFRVYPNPTAGWITIEYPKGQATQVELWDLQGRLVKQTDFARSEAMRLSVEDLASGSYLLDVKGVGYTRIFVE